MTDTTIHTDRALNERKAAENIVAQMLPGHTTRFIAVYHNDDDTFHGLSQFSDVMLIRGTNHEQLSDTYIYVFAILD